MNDEEDLELLFFFDLIENGNIEAIREYIASGFDVNAQREEGTTPLLVAANARRLEIVKMLVEAGADVDRVDVYGSSPLMCAIFNKNWELFNYLEPLTNTDIKRIGLLTSIFDEDIAAVRALIATGIDVDSCKETGVRQKTGRTALILAIWEEHSEIVEILLQAGADPNLMDEDSGTTPLICAVRVQNIEIVDLLVRSGANINARDISQNTALNIATKLGNSEIVRVLQKAENKDRSI